MHPFQTFWVKGPHLGTGRIYRDYGLDPPLLALSVIGFRVLLPKQPWLGDGMHGIQRGMRHHENFLY